MWSAHAITERETAAMSDVAGPDHWPASDEQGTPAPDGVDPTVPSPARMYDYYLGGATNYAADREAAERALSVVPSGRLIARANRYFMMRAVLLMADQGIRQFIDLGTGIPTSPSVHELAQAIHPNARVLYVDNDPVVAVHNRPLLAASANVKALQADIRQPDSILGSVEARELIDFSQPVGVLFVAVLHFVRDQEDPQGIVRAFTGRLVPGSYLALSHISGDGTDVSVMATIRQAYADAMAPAVFRTNEQVHAFFSGFEIVSPGLADVTRWGPYAATRPAPPSGLNFLAGIGYKQPAVRLESEHGPSVRDWPLHSHLELRALDTAPSCARKHARQIVQEWGLSALADATELVVSELTTNAVKASRDLLSPVLQLWLVSDHSCVVIHVWDGSKHMPERQYADLDTEGGRGLLIVDAFCSEWGTYTSASGKAVWAMIK
jgi:S-adenosyl methyltransferase